MLVLLTLETMWGPFSHSKNNFIEPKEQLLIVIVVLVVHTKLDPVSVTVEPTRSLISTPVSRRRREGRKQTRGPALRELSSVTCSSRHALYPPP